MMSEVGVATQQVVLYTWQLQLFRCFLSTVSGWLADLASDSEGVDLFQVSQGLVDLRRPGRMRSLGTLSRWIYNLHKSNTPYKACKNLRQKLYLQRTCINSGALCGNMTLMFGYFPPFLWETPLQLWPGRHLPTSGRSGWLHSHQPLQPDVFFSGARCKSYPCWDSISHSILYGRNICSPVKVQTHEYVMN